jgi:hypothetical protein
VTAPEQRKASGRFYLLLAFHFALLWTVVAAMAWRSSSATWFYGIPATVTLLPGLIMAWRFADRGESRLSADVRSGGQAEAASSLYRKALEADFASARRVYRHSVDSLRYYLCSFASLAGVVVAVCSPAFARVVESGLEPDAHAPYYWAALLVVDGNSVKPRHGAHWEMGAAIVMTACITSYAVSTAGLANRLSRRDLTARRVATSLGALVASVVGGALAFAVVERLSVGCDPPTVCIAVLIAGITAGLLGEAILGTVVSVISLVFGVSAGGDDLDTFDKIDGLDDDERLRVKEHGVQSIQGLATASIANLYIGTRYSFESIRDWMDQALLVLRMGIVRIDEVRRAGFRKATDVHQWATRSLSESNARGARRLASAVANKLSELDPKVGAGITNPLAAISALLAATPEGAGEPLASCLAGAREAIVALDGAAARASEPAQAGALRAASTALAQEVDTTLNATKQYLVAALQARGLDEALAPCFEGLLADPELYRLAFLYGCYVVPPGSPPTAETAEAWA